MKPSVTALAVLLFAACQRAHQEPSVPEPPRIVDPDALSAVVGIVRDQSTQQGIANARVVLTCACRAEPIELRTDERGLYAFRELPRGIYTMRVTYQKSDVTKTFELSAGDRLHSSFRIDPNDPTPIRVIVHRPRSPSSGHDSAERRKRRSRRR